MPSLAQLDEAVRAWLAENPDDEVTVVVDATFAHRIDPSERPQFEEAAAHHEIVYPPAGAIGRGDAFLLRVAEKTGAVVFSNDSFQEFHGEHDWLFTKGRLVGGTPVPNIGWVFVPRTPVRGPKSRDAVREAKRTKARIGSKDASKPMPMPAAPPPRPKSKSEKQLDKAIAEATEEALDPVDGEEKSGGRKRRRKRGGGTAKSAKPLVLPTMNEPLPFLNFVAEHPRPGERVTAVVDSYQSHGAFVVSGDTRCYVPLSAMGDPPPRSAREVLTKGEEYEFVIQAFDPARRGIELALPNFAHPAGHPTEETVEAEVELAPEPAPAPAKKAARKRTKKAAAPEPAPQQLPAADLIPIVVEAPQAVPLSAVKVKAAPATTKTKKTKKAEKAAAEKKKVAAPKKAAAKKVAVKKAAAKKSAAPKKAAAKKTATPKKAAAKKAAVKKAAVTKAPAKKSPAKKSTAKKSSAKKAAKAAKAAKKAT